MLSDGHPEINETRNEFIKSIIQKYGGAPATDDEFEFISVVSKAISRNPPGKRFHNFFSGKFRYWTAASIIVLILIPVGYFSTRKSVDPDDLYKKYFSPVVPLTLRGGANSDSIYYKGVIQYNTGNYKEAIGTFNLIPENHNFALLVDLYKANAYMVLGDYKKALEIMAPILDQGCLFTDDVAWYMALCELKLGQFKKASRHLELVINCYPKPNYPIKLKKALKKKIKKIGRASCRERV